MNKKGFTLIEIIGAVIILGIIAVIAFNTFASNLRGFRDDFYTETTTMLAKSGQEFFNDNRNYRPGTILGAQKVSLSTLETKNYIDEVVDYNGDSCEKDSYVLVVKEGRDEYSYHTCLVCKEDNYDNTNDEYCDAAWLDPTKVTYGIGDLPILYVYKGISKEEVREKLELPVSYVRKNSKGEVIKSIRGDGEDDLPTILPVDIDIVDTSKVGTYIVHYEYKPVTNGKENEVVERKEGKVIVYENQEPGLTITYEDKVAKAGASLENVRNGVVETKTGNYTSGTWAQDITVKLTSRAITEPGVTPAKYQWNKDGRWQDFCTTTTECTVTLSKDMNETIQFRMIDTNGKISKTTSPVIIRRDKKSPTCTIATNGTYGDNSWYTSNVEVKFTSYDDQLSTTQEAISGVRIKNIYISTEAVDRKTNITTKTHTTDTKSIRYIGYVEDQAHNYSTCEVVFKRDTKNPVCELQLKGTVGDNSWYTTNVEVSFKTSKDDTSGVRRYGIGSDTGEHSKTHTEDTASKTYTGYIRDNAGHTSSCNISFKKDSTKPVCGSWSGESTSWTSGNRTVSIGCSDAMSSCVQSSYSNTTSSGTTSTKSITFTLKDKAGNTQTCSKTANVYVDKDKPTCGSWSGESTSWTASNRTIGVGCSDTGSGCDGTYSTTISSGTTSTKSISFTIKDKVGNTNTCSKTANVYVDKDKPTCGSWSGESTSWTASNRTIGVGCNDTGSGCDGTYSTTISSGTTSTKSISFTIKDKVGHTATCSKTANVYVDKDKPTCTTSKSNTNSTDGVTVTISCSDSGSGCSNSTKTGVKSNTTYTVSDGVGHTNTCSVSVSAVSQARSKSCTAGNRCSGAGCQTWNYCSHSECGVAAYKYCSHAECGVAAYNSCASAGCAAYNTCSHAECGVAAYNSCAHSECGVGRYKYCANSACGKTYSGKCKCVAYNNYTTKSFSGRSSCPGNSGCKTICGGSSATMGGTQTSCTGSNKSCRTKGCGVDYYNTCATPGCGIAAYNSCATSGCGCAAYNAGPVCGVAAYNSCRTSGCGVESYNSCRTGGCGCETYNANVGTCGCASWGSYGNWYDSACTAGETSNHATTYECRTVYR